MAFMIDLIFAFVEVAKDLRPDYIENWLNGKVKDYDMDMTLLSEKQYRETTYIKIQNLREDAQ